MSKPVYCIAGNVTSPLGLSTEAVWRALQEGKSGVRRIADPALHPREIWAAQLDAAQWEDLENALPDQELSPLERMAIWSASDACGIAGADLSKALFVFSSTKGNIEWLGSRPDERNRLSRSAALIAGAAGIPTKPVVISHACVSGVAALIYAMRALQSGRYETAVVTGADRLTAFVVAGFASFQALAEGPCRPFDAARKGINLGEAAATIILSTKPGPSPLAILAGGSTSNDANHISGPSRTGAELAQAIGAALGEGGLRTEEIGLVSAHGTATIYNDEMESRAFAAAGLLGAPVHSLKGYFGHTLGAAGLLESALLIESLRHGLSIASAGYQDCGVPHPLNISTSSGAVLDARHALKTASGFGGCNAAVVWSKV